MAALVIRAADGTETIIADERPIEIQRQEALETAAAARWSASQSFSYGDWISVACDDTAQSRLTAAVVGLQVSAPGRVVGWEMMPGQFLQMGLADLAAFGEAMFEHVQACWANFARISVAIQAASNPEALAAVDVQSGWPA